jgi:hypothetical protein
MNETRLLDDSANQVIDTAIKIFISHEKPMGKIMYFAGMNPTIKPVVASENAGDKFISSSGAQSNNIGVIPARTATAEAIPEQAFMD